MQGSPAMTHGKIRTLVVGRRRSGPHTLRRPAACKVANRSKTDKNFTTCGIRSSPDTRSIDSSPTTMDWPWLRRCVKSLSGSSSHLLTAVTLSATHWGAMFLLRSHAASRTKPGRDSSSASGLSLHSRARRRRSVPNAKQSAPARLIAGWPGGHRIVPLHGLAAPANPGLSLRPRRRRRRLRVSLLAHAVTIGPAASQRTTCLHLGRRGHAPTIANVCSDGK